MNVSHDHDGHMTFMLSSGGIGGVFANGAFLSAFAAFATAQTTKVFTHWYKEGRWDLSRLTGSGGMPSSHSALVLGLTSAIGVSNGTSSELFAMCLVVSLIVMYDACGVRLQAGRHAGVLNQIISELPPDHPVSDVRPLRDSLGHTPLQVVVGAFVGIVVGYVTQVSLQGIVSDDGSSTSPVFLGNRDGLRNG
jgi:acid phosphatase family membrane protein YuiD